MLKYLSLLFSFILFFGCTLPQKASPQKPLVIGMSVNYPPIAFTIDNQPAGVEADFAKRLSDELHRDINIKILPWNQLYPALRSGEIDMVMSGVSITKRRSEHVLFSEPYMQISQMALMRDSTPAPNMNTYGRGRHIGYVFSTTGEQFVKTHFDQAAHHGFTSHQHGIAAVMNGDIDYFFHDAPTIWHYTAEMSLDNIVGWYVPYTAEDLAWAFDANNTTLRDHVNTVIAKWRSDGTLSSVVNNWIRVKVYTPSGQKPIRFE